VDGIADHFATRRVDKVLGIEARGFILAAPVAYRFGAGFVPVRKAGKLPWQIEKEEYELEYGTDLLEIHRDAVGPGEQVLVVDDVLATGGTAAATVRLVEKLGGDVVGLGLVIELGFLHGRDKLRGRDVVALAAALLHDAVEDTGVTVDDIAAEFGPEIAAIVDGVTKLDRVSFDSREAQQAASMRKMLVAMAKDIRVLLIKLADRLHNM